MRNNVTFQYPAPFVQSPDYDGIFGIGGAAWFVELLERLPGIEIDRPLCQEDWGVVVFVRRGGAKFWIGLSPWRDGIWLAHFHHLSMAWLQRLSSAGRAEYRRLLCDFHDVLQAHRDVSNVVWHEERAMCTADPPSFDSPVDQV